MDTPRHESLQEFFRRAREDLEEIFGEARKSIDESFEEAKKNIGDAYDSDSTTWDDDSETDDKSSENLDISEELEDVNREEDGPLLDADNTGNQYPKIDWNAIVGMGLIFIALLCFAAGFIIYTVGMADEWNANEMEYR